MGLLRRALASQRAKTPTAGTIEGGDWDLVDMRTGKLLSGYSETETGEPVTAEAALGYHPWYRAISLLAQKAAAVPKYLYSQAKRGKRTILQEVPDHTVFDLIKRRVNSEQTAFHFWLQMTGHVASRGNGYAVIYRESLTNRIEEIIPLDPDRTHPFRKGSELWYVCFPFGESGNGFRFRANEVLHFRGFGFDGLIGYPLWEIAANELGLGRAQRKLEGQRYRNSGRPSMILETDMKLKPDTKDRILSQWGKMYVGLDNAGKTAILDHGIKAKPISMTAEELTQTGAVQMSLAAISNYTGVPVSKLGGLKSAASSESEDRAFISDGLDFYLNLEDDEVTAKLLSQDEQKGGMVVISNREALLRPEFKTKYEILRIATAGRPIMTPNEAREEIDLPPSEEPDADKLLVPLNMGKGGKANDPVNPADDGPGRPEGEDSERAEGEDVEDTVLAQAREAARFAMAHATTRMVKRIGQDAVRAAKGVSSFIAFVDSIRTNARVFRSEFAPSERMTAAISPDGKPNQGDAAGYLLEVLIQEWSALAEHSKEKALASDVEALASDQLVRLPQDVLSIFFQEGQS